MARTGRSLDRFSRRMLRRANAVTKNGAKLVKFVALAVDEAVVAATPVDEGTAISNWIASLGSPSSATRKAFALGKSGSTEAENIVAQIGDTARVLKRHKPGQSIFITNNLEYIGELNAGSSPQADADYVRVAAAAAAKAAASGKVKITSFKA